MLYISKNDTKTRRATVTDSDTGVSTEYSYLDLYKEFTSLDKDVTSECEAPLMLKEVYGLCLNNIELEDWEAEELEDEGRYEEANYGINLDKSLRIEAQSPDTFEWYEKKVKEIRTEMARDKMLFKRPAPKVRVAGYNWVILHRISVPYIPEYVTHLGYAFCMCLEADNLVVPKTVRYVEDCAFSDSYIEKITFEGDLDYIGASVFEFVDGLGLIAFMGDIKDFSPDMFEDFTSVYMETFLFCSEAVEKKFKRDLSITHGLKQMGFTVKRPPKEGEKLEI